MGGLSRKALFTAVDDSLRRSASTTSISIKFIAGTTRRPSKRPCKRLPKSSSPEKSATLGPRQCSPGSSPRHFTRPPRAGGLCVHAAAVQSALPRRRARDVRAVRGRGDRRPALESAGPRQVGAALGRPTHHAPRGHGRSFASPLCQHHGGRPSGRRPLDASCSGTRRAARSNLRGLAIASTDRHGPDHRRASKPHHLNNALAALSLTLSADELAALEEPYVPHAVVGLNPKPSKNKPS